MKRVCGGRSVLSPRAASLPLGRALRVGGMALSLCARLGAQQPAAPPRFATIVGVVEDSLRRGPLANATVIVLNTSRSAITNARGLFQIDSVEPGEVRLGVRHALMDTLGLSILSEIVRVVAGQRLEVRVSTATFDSVRDRLCVRGGVSNGSAMLVGRILEADTDAPIPAVAVSLVYQDSSSIVVRDRVRQTRSRDDGSFAICGLPESFTGTVQALQGRMSTPELPVTLKNGVLATALLTFSASPESVAVLEGRITTRTGEPLAEAQVAITGTSRVAVTRADGTFSLTGLPSGTAEAVVRKIGFAPVTRAMALTRREPRRLAVQLSPMQLLAAVKVEGKLDAGLQKAGFLDRKRAGQGSFLSPEEIDRRKPEMFTDLMQSVSGFRVVPVGGGRIVQATRAGSGAGDGCLNVFIDRAPFVLTQPGDLDGVLRGPEVGAVEAYPSPTSVPPEFQAAGKACAALVIWTKFKLGRP